MRRAIWRLFGWHYFYVGKWLMFCELVLRTIQPYAVGKLTLYFTTDKITFEHAVGCAAYLAITAIAFALMRNNFFFHAMRTGIRAKSAMNLMVYRKILRLSESSLNEV